MTFNSIEFVAFLALVVLVTWRLRHRQQNLLLLGASYAFYAAWDWRFLALLIISTVIGYTSGIALAEATGEGRRRAILASRVVMNLAMLAVFKYANFFVDSAADLLDAVGLHAGHPTLDILLPVAISYYTFEEISYAVDIYRRELEPSRSPVDYGLFVAFFPKLVAGPILRPKELLPQISEPRVRPDRATITSALALIFWGLVKKVVIADTLAGFVDQIYAEPGRMSAAALTVGTLCFAGQIYGDFSGYSDIARGSARLLGFELPLNFRQPYLSSSLTAFWRTWHISLSSWLRDYLYVPLGGNRRGSRRTTINLMTVMLLGGLWHGAGWPFLIWGGIHGAALAVERTLPGTVDNARTFPTMRQVPRIVATFAVVCLAWVFFRAPDLATALEIVGRTVSLRGGDLSLSALAWVLLAAVVFLSSDLVERAVQTGRAAQLSVSPGTVGALVGAAIAGLVVTSGGSPVPFIYFQF